MSRMNGWLAILITITLLLPCWSAASEAGPDFLALIDAGDRAAVVAVERLAVPVYHRSDRYLLAGLDADQLDTVGPGARVVDRSPWSDRAAYYWVLVRGTERVDLEDFDGVRVLYGGKGTALIKARPEAAEALPPAGYDIVRVTRSAKPAGAAGASTRAAGARDFGGVIDDMVADVTLSNYTDTIQTLEDFGTRYTYAAGVDNAADWIYATFQGFGLDVERHYFSISSYTKQNIIATKVGHVYPDEVVFITGHYDSTSEDPYNSAPGADDNASGTSAVIEAARVMANYEFARTIKFACFAGEEQGLVGSSAYVADIAGAGMNVIGCFNFDMIAWSGTDPAPPDMIIYTNGASTDLADELYDAALYYVPTEVEPVIINDALGASDHASFWSHGYQAVLGIEEEAWGADFNPYYHTTSDTVSICDLDYATACTKIGVAAVADYATPYDPTGMRVTPFGEFVSEGPGGGPFTPDQIVYTLINYEAFPIDYSVSKTQPWIDLSATGGTILGGGQAYVTVSINSTADSLPDGQHSDTVSFVNETNHDGDTTRGVQLTVGVPVVQYEWTMDTDPGWTISGGEWAFGVPTGGGGTSYGNPDPTSGATGSNVYGYNLAGDYSTAIGGPYYLATGAIDCSELSEVSLHFQRWLNSDYQSYVYQTIEASNDGSSWTMIWNNGTSEITDNSWSEQIYDLSAMADGEATVYIRWGHEVASSGAWAYSGWNIDDVQIYGILEESSADTVSAGITCVPASGTLPFTVQFGVSLNNLTAAPRRDAARIDLVLGNGTSVSSWKAGWTNLLGYASWSSQWNQTIPALGSLVGQNSFTLVAEDVTPAPFNQPPYAPSGDTDTGACTVTAGTP